jgi:catalase
MTESTKPTTTDGGAAVASDEHSLTIGADGPIVLNVNRMRRAAALSVLFR